MKETFLSVIEDIAKYANDSMLIIIFLVSVFFLLLAEKDKKTKIIIAVVPIVLALVYICPLYAYVGKKMDSEVYYRTFWSIPVAIICCFAAIKAVMHFKNIIVRGVVCVLALAVIVLNGKLVYANSIHFKSVNEYHIPQVVINVADAMVMEEYTPVAAMPAELLPFLRQYTAGILTPYGRNVIETSWSKWGMTNELYDAMEAEVYDTALIAKLAKEQTCAYVVLSCAKQQTGSLEDEGYLLKAFVDGYYIYMDNDYYQLYKTLGYLDEDDYIEGK